MLIINSSFHCKFCSGPAGRSLGGSASAGLGLAALDYSVRWWSCPFAAVPGAEWIPMLCAWSELYSESRCPASGNCFLYLSPRVFAVVNYPFLVDFTWFCLWFIGPEKGAWHIRLPPWLFRMFGLSFTDLIPSPAWWFCVQAMACDLVLWWFREEPPLAGPEEVFGLKMSVAKLLL